MCSNFENITARMTAPGIRLQLGKLLDGGGPFDTVHAWPKRPATIIRADGDDWRTDGVALVSGAVLVEEGPAQKISTYNARAETVHSAPAYRGPWRSRRRCLIPATSWYEPAKTLGMKGWARIDPSAPAITFGGLWDTWKPRDGGEPVHSFTIITTEPAPSIAHVHNRMPLIIPAPERDRWLDPEVDGHAVRELLVPIEDDYRVVTPEA